MKNNCDCKEGSEESCSVAEESGELGGKVAVVTGASKGIGAGIAKRLACAGAAVVVNYASDKAGAEKLVASINEKGGKAIAVKADVTSRAELAALFSEAEKTFGKIDILVNNSGVYEFAPLEAVTGPQISRQFDINVTGLIVATQEALKRFNPEGGAIINISSIVGLAPLPNASVYSATKGAVDALTKSWALEFGAKKIRVNSVNPGMIETEGVHSAGFIGGDFQKDIVSKTPLGRIGDPDDVAKVVLFLASSRSGWVNGETIRVDGGMR